MIDLPIAIRSVRWADGGEDSVAEARLRHRAAFPGRSARRMTHLGMLVDLCLRELAADDDAPVIYASAFAESCSLEDFIDSFPAASPLLFQTSIHPSAVEQSCIARQRPVRRFYPITSEENLAGKALENAALLLESSAILVAGEEKGSWLAPHGLASDRSFAFALELARAETDALGSIRFLAAELDAATEGVGLPDLWAAIRDGRPLRVPSFALGGWLQLEWRS